MSDFSLTLVLQIKTSKNHQWHGKGKHKIWENHSFWRNISCEGAFSRFVGPVIDKVLGLRCTSLAISTARLWVLCQVSTSVAATVWRMWRAIKLNSLLVKVLMNTGQLAADCGNHRETLWTLLHPCKQPLVAVWLPAGSAWMAVRGNQRHRVWAEFHPYGEVGGQGIPSCHTAATACMILFHDSGYRCLIHFYIEKVCRHMRHLFPKVVSYNRWSSESRSQICLDYAEILCKREQSQACLAMPSAADIQRS